MVIRMQSQKRRLQAVIFMIPLILLTGCGAPEYRAASLKMFIAKIEPLTIHITQEKKFYLNIDIRARNRRAKRHFRHICRLSLRSADTKLWRKYIMRIAHTRFTG